MTAPPSSKGEGPNDGPGYFLVRIQHSVGDQSEISGMVECLGLGEKRRFETGKELLRLLATWPGHGWKIGGAP